jgi:NTP pyrophosphatase (non-canonical NTP hydrolase)
VEGRNGEVQVSVPAAVMNNLADEIGEWSVSKGFREDWELADALEDIAEGEAGLTVIEGETLAKAANALRINIVGMKLMLTVSELSEALETLRDNGMAIMHGAGNFGEEIGDAEIRIKELANLLKIPIGDEVVRKVAANNDRPYKHGRKHC